MIKKIIKKRVHKKNSDYISINQLIEAINRQMEGGTLELENEELANKLEEYATFIQRKEDERSLEINDILRKLTELDEVRDMIKGITSQVNSVQLIVASSEELATANDNIAEMTIHTQMESQHAKDNGAKGIENIIQAIEFVEGAFTAINEVNQKISLVEEKVKEVNHIIEVVKDIAWQTNLLSLNASIEAARAGEDGKGFAIVAGEVKSLSQYTEKSANTIGEGIAELKEITLESAEKIHQITKQIYTGQELMEKSLMDLQSIGQSIEQVDQNIMQLSSIAEEQSSATRVLATEIIEVSNEATYLEERCLQTATDIFALSNYVEEIRKKQLAQGISLPISDQIEIYKVDHLLWRWKVYNVLMGLAEGDSEAAGNYKECRLGKWYYGVTDAKMKNNKDFIRLESPHIQLHIDARDGMIAYQKGDIHTAELKLKAMEQCSAQVMEILDCLKAIM